MRILIVSHSYPPYGLAGVERLAEQTARQLAAAGHTVSVLTRRPTPAPPALRLEEAERDGVRIHWVTGGGTTFGRYPGHDEALERIFERTLAATAPDVVLLSHLLHHSPGYVEVAHRFGILVLLELHDFYVACPLAHLLRVSGELCAGPEGGRACATACFATQPAAEPRWALRAHAFRLAMERADAVVAPSNFIADYFENWSGGRRPQVLPNAVAFEAQPRMKRADDGVLRLASVGVVVDHKGQHLIIEALAAAALPAVELRLVGVAHPPYAERLRRMAEAVPGLELNLYGPFEPGQLPALIADSDALVVSALVPESFSIVTREAFACGIPVVAPRAGALPEAIRDRENGLLYALGDAADLASALRRLADEATLRESLANGIRRTDWISESARTERLLEILHGMRIAGARPGRPELWWGVKALRDGLPADDLGALTPI